MTSNRVTFSWTHRGIVHEYAAPGEVELHLVVGGAPYPTRKGGGNLSLFGPTILNGVSRELAARVPTRSSDLCQKRSSQMFLPALIRYPRILTISK